MHSINVQHNTSRRHSTSIQRRLQCPYWAKSSFKHCSDLAILQPEGGNENVQQQHCNTILTCPLLSCGVQRNTPLNSILCSYSCKVAKGQLQISLNLHQAPQLFQCRGQSSSMAVQSRCCVVTTLALACSAAPGTEGGLKGQMWRLLL